MMNTRFILIQDPHKAGQNQFTFSIEPISSWTTFEQSELEPFQPLVLLRQELIQCDMEKTCMLKKIIKQSSYD